MDHGPTDDEAFDLTGPLAEADEELSSSGAWGGVGARRGPKSAAEGVRIIGAEEAAAAIEAGQVTGRRPEDAPRFGDVPEAPSEPRPELRFPGVDPAAVEKPPVVEPPYRPPPPPSDRTPGGPEASPEERRAPGESLGHDAGPGYAAPTMSREPSDDGGFSPSEHHPFWEESADPGPMRAGGAGGEGPASGPVPTLPHWTEPPSGEHPRILPDAEGSADNDDDLKAWSSLSTGPRWRDHHTDWDEADFADDIFDDPEARMGALRERPPDDDDLAAPLSPPPASPPPPPASRRQAAPAASRHGAPSTPAGQGGASSTDDAPRNVTQSVITGVVALAVVLAAAAVGPGAFVFLVAAVLVMAVAELYQALRIKGHHPATLLGVAATAGLVGAVYWQAFEGFQLVLALFMLFSLLWYLSGVVRGRPVIDISLTVLGFLYVGMLGSFAALLLKFPLDHGIGLLLGAVLATAAYDIGAFFGGRWAGRTPLAPDISPGKTVEGMVVACFATFAVCVIVVAGIDPWTFKRAFLLSLVAMVAAPLGDLCESMIKRDLGVKDMGTILPGHGGILDRIDALLFVVPATYYLVRFLKFF